MRLTAAQISAQVSLAQEALGRGDISSATKRIAAVIQSNPDASQAYHAKALILATQGMHAAAFATLETALRYDPTNPETLGWLAVTSLNLQDGVQAEKFARRLTKFHPRTDRGHFLLANALSLQNRLEEAVASVDRALELSPRQADFVVGKAQLLGRLGWSSQAVEWYRRAVSLSPRDELSIEMCQSLLEVGQAQEALSVLESLTGSIAVESFPHALLAQAYTETQDFNKAENAWKLAAAYGEDPADILTARIQAEVFAGRLDIAEELANAALSASSCAPSVYLTLTSIRRISSRDSAFVEEMEGILQSRILGSTDRADLCYALGKAFHDLGEHEKAIGYFDTANQLCYEASNLCNRFHADAWRAYTDAQIETFFVDRLSSLRSDFHESVKLLFIIGMIRSGTTLIEQILSGHSSVFGGGETTFWADHRLEIFDSTTRLYRADTALRLARMYFKSLGENCRSYKVVTEKNPANVTIAPLIHCAMPNARFLHVARRPVDNLLSIWMTPIRSGLPFLYNRENLVSAFKDYLRLAKHLERTLPKDKYQTFHYEAVTSAPEPNIERMLAYLNLEPEIGCFHPETNRRTVRTPSTYQVRQSINTDSQNKWKLYEPWLGEFAELLEVG